MLIACCFIVDVLGQVDADTAKSSHRIPSAWRADADLRDVCFVDEDYGWAVGDHGTIWHTQNGGEVWRPQESTVDCQLSTVSFVSREIGWAAGGVVIPITHRSKSTLLRTNNGGESWERVTGLLLTAISRISFSDQQHGYAAGMSTALHPSGAWSTRDGGRTWSPLQGVAGQHWTDASFNDRSGLLLSRNGERAWMKNGRLTRAGRHDEPLRNANYGVLIDSEISVAGPGIPQGSLDQGNTWQGITSVPLPDDLDIRTVAAHESHLWLAGSPGTRILHSPDLGRTWHAAITPVSLPVQRLHFIDSSHGWAVGARGMILATKNGGATWKQQRGGAKRMAVLAVVADERDIPWETLTQASAEAEFRVHIVVIANSAGQNPLHCETERRLEDAAMRIGATAEVLTQLPFVLGCEATATELLALWQDRDARALEKLSSKLTHLIRVYRPDVILTSQISPHKRTANGAQQLVTRLVADACEYSASAHVFPDQVTQLGLQAWPVTRLLTVRRTQGVAPSPRTRMTALGSSTQDLAQSSRRLVTKELQTNRWSLYSIQGDAKPTNFGRYPLSGLLADYDSPQRRARTIQSIDVAGHRQQIQRRLQTLRILSAETIVGRGTRRVEQIDRLLGTDRRAAGDTIFELANREIETGNLAEADLLLRRLVTGYNEHGLTDEALHWLVAHHSSVEQMWREYRESNSHFRSDPNVQLASAQQTITVANSTLPGVENTDGEQPPEQEPVSAAFKASWAKGQKLAREIKTKRPDLYGEPKILFPLAAMSRLAGQEAAARGILRRQTSLPATSWWRGRADQELGILDGELTEGQALWTCRQVRQQPHLDGKLDDLCWQQSSIQELYNPKKLPVTRVWLSHDDRHLYLAASCPKRSTTTYLPKRRPRPRDANLSSMDRIQVLLDINRDYTSWWKIAIDHRGWTSESLSDDSSWNPKYFVASSSDDQSWTIEVAIPLEELAPPEYLRDNYWALGVRRIVPESFVESWSSSQVGVETLDLQGLILLE